MPRRLFASLFVLFVMQTFAYAQSFQIVTNQEPPIKSVTNDTLGGISGDILLTLLEQAGYGRSKKEISVHPYFEALTITKTQANTIMLAIPRTPTYEHWFKWVGPITCVQPTLIAKKSHHLTPASFKNSSSLRIGCIKGSAPHAMLQTTGFPEEQIHAFDFAQASLSALATDTIDMLILPDQTLKAIMQEQKDAAETYETVLTFPRIDIFIAFNTNYSDDFIARLQCVFNTMLHPRKDGKSLYERIVEKYK